MQYLFSELVDIENLKLFMNSIYKITQISMKIVELDGTILVSCQSNNICKELYKTNSNTKIKCPEYIKNEYNNGEQRKYFVCKCSHDISNIVSPIVINGQKLAYLFTGQFLLKKSDFFNAQIEINKDEVKNQDYTKYIKDIPVISQDKFKLIIDFHLQLIELINSIGSNFIKKLETQKKLKLTEERYRLAIIGSNDAVWEWNMENDEFFISERWKEIIELDIPEKYNFFKNLINIIHEDDMPKFDLELKKHILGETPFFQCEYRIKIKDGKIKWILQRGKMLHNEKGQHIRMAGSITDITSRRIYEEEIRYQLYYDYLTNLPNRLSLINKLNEKINAVADYKAAVFIIDINNFKIINNTFGEEIGDKILVLAAEKLEKYKNKQESLYRLDADEFLLLLSDYKNEKEVEQRAEDIINIFKDYFEISCKNINIRVNIGTVVFPDNGDNADELLHNGYVALHNSKKIGADRYTFFSKAMSDELINKVKLETELARAIENKEFILYYQPQVNICNNKVYGLEALIRWNHPERGILSPAYFIDIVEQNGMINSIGKFVLYEACSELKRLHDKGFNKLVMSVNVSVKQLEDKDFYDYFEQTLIETKVDPKFIDIEITEGVLLNSSIAEINILKLLRETGSKVFIDDFGTKYSSLNYIYKFPVDGIKIDKSFIDEIKKSEKEFIVLKNIITLAKDIDIDVIAEGVEDSEQLEKLQTINCDKVQGYIFDKPIASENIVDCLNKYQ